MAEKRMFSKKIIDTDWFMDMPASTQNLYFHLSMRADDDGFVANPRRIIKLVGASDDDYKLLIAKKFVIVFESGICVITDWRINNYLRADRYTETTYKEEKKLLVLDDKGKYELGIPSGIPSVDPEYSLSNSNSNSIIYNKEIDKAKSILEYLNQEAGTHFKPVESNLKFIKARLKDYTEEDLRAVIDKKVDDWKGGEMQMYLRPETLFNATKFETYLNGLEDRKGFKNYERKYSRKELNAQFQNIDEIEI